MRLTRHEITMLLSLIAALVVGAAVKHYRSTHPPANPLPTASRGR